MDTGLKEQKDREQEHYLRQVMRVCPVCKRKCTRTLRVCPTCKCRLTI